MRCVLPILVTLAILFSGCVPVTQPLSDPITAEIDESLYGHWVATERLNEHLNRKNEDLLTIHLFIGKHEKGNVESICDAVWIIHNKLKKNRLEQGQMCFTSTRVGNRSYVNGFSPKIDDMGGYEQAVKDGKLTFQVFSYTSDGKIVTTWVFSDDELKKGVEDGVLKKDGESYTAASLASYLRKNGNNNKLFEKYLVFEKQD